MGLRLLKMAAVALLALVVGYAAALGLGLVVLDVFEFSQREGANAMTLAFIVCPFVAVLSAVVTASRYWIVSARRTATPDSTALAAPRGDATRVVAIAVSGVVGWFAGALLQWVLTGHSYETFVVAFAVSLAPWIFAIVFGGVTWRLIRRR